MIRSPKMISTYLYISAFLFYFIFSRQVSIVLPDFIITVFHILIQFVSLGILCVIMVVIFNVADNSLRELPCSSSNRDVVGNVVIL